MVAPRIIWRYILRDVLLYTTLGLAIITLLLVMQQTLRMLEDLLASGVGVGAMLGLMSIVLPSYFAYALPTALLFGVLLAFGRLSGDGEIVAIRASGVSVPNLLPPVLALGVIAGMFSAYLVFEVEPRGRRELTVRLREMGRVSSLIQPGRFREVGARTFYVSSEGRDDCPLRGVLVGDLEDPKRPLYITARCGRLSDPGESGAVGLELAEGSIQFFSGFDDDRFRTIRFERMTTQIDVSPYLQRTRRARDYTFAELLDLDTRLASGEEIELHRREGRTDVQVQIHRRVAFPFASLVLAVLAVPLGIQPLRSGRSAGALTAVGLMGAYWVLFTLAEDVGTRGWLPAWLVLWVPNLLVLGAGVYMLRRTIRGES